MSARHEHKPIKKKLCELCSTTDTVRINLPKNRGGHTITVVAHRASCKSDQIEYCMQDVDGGGSYRWGYSSKCCRPVKGLFKGGTWQWSQGAPACGMHLAHETKIVKKAEAAESAAEVSAYLKDQMGEKLKLIQELTGIVAQLHYRRGYNYFNQYLDSEWILVRADDLIAAINVEVE